ncbi:MAG: transposase [Clostridia bacterium]|nr:transposase [Clostridia bacterium]
MHNEDRNTSFRILMLITTPALAGKAAALFHEGAVPIQYQLHGLGTASSEIMDALGLGDIEKSILVGMMPKPFADEMLHKLRKKLEMYTPNSGIAFTMPITGTNNHMLRMLSTLNEEGGALLKRRNHMNDINYTLVAAVVNQGFSEDVMKAAKAAGAGGGTVIHSRRITNESTLQFWGLSFQEEKEIVLILTRAEEKLAIMQAVSDHCGIHSEAKGIVLSLPIDSVVGLEEN